MRAPKSLRIISYFSLPTDLAKAMRAWPEFIAGEGYDVSLRDAKTKEEVTVRLIADENEPHVIFSSPKAGPLFDRVVGCALVAMSAHSDTLVINPHEPKA
jgi:hypothetical protein